MSNFKEYTIFNSVDPASLTPKQAHFAPFPLEDIDHEISTAYAEMKKIMSKFVLAKKNPTTDTPAKKRRLKSLIYKTQTILTLLQEINSSVSEL